MPHLQVSNLYKTYHLGRVAVRVLRGAALDVEKGEWLAVLGASGSGKSTLLHLVGGLDRPDRDPRGTITFNGRDITRLAEGALNHYRCLTIGFVFQFYHLLPELNVVENTLIGAMVRHGRFRFYSKRNEATRRAVDLLVAFGLEDRIRHRPNELSGGERQRVAIARALMNSPELLLADEPTGNLDADTGAQILDVIEELHRKEGQTTIMVTHDPAIAARADRVVHLENGQVVGAPSRTVRSPQEAAAAEEPAQ